MCTFSVNGSTATDDVDHEPIAQKPGQSQEEAVVGDHKVSPTRSRDISLITCSLTSGIDDVGSCMDQEDQPPSVCEDVHDEYEEPQNPQAVERILSVDMFSRFATAYAYPIGGDGGEYDDDYSSDDEDDEDDEAHGDDEDDGKNAPTSSGNDNEPREDRSSNRNRCKNHVWSQQSGYSLDGERFLENEDAGDNDMGCRFHRGHRRASSFPWDIRNDVSTPPTQDKGIITTTPPKLMKKRAPPMIHNQRRSLSMSNADLNGRFGGQDALPSGSVATAPPRVPSSNFNGTAGGTPHRRVVSAHSPLSDLLEITSLSASPRPPRPPCSSAGSSPRLRPRAGLPPRPSGHPITLSSQVSWTESERIDRTPLAPYHKRSHSAPMIPSPGSTSSVVSTTASQHSAGLTVQHHLRSFSGNFKALHDASKSLYLSQIHLDASPDASLLGSRPKHHTRNHSLDSRSTTMSTKSKESTSSEASQDESEAEQKWNEYYEHKMMKKNVLKDELKYRLSKAMPKDLVKRLSLSSQPALKRADSAKFV